jgi:hypothetical protein
MAPTSAESFIDEEVVRELLRAGVGVSTALDTGAPRSQENVTSLGPS